MRSVQSRPVRRNLLAALVVFLVSFGIRAWFVGSTQHHPISDARHYERRAHHILEHGAMPDGAYRTPAYPYFLASIVKVAGPGWRAPAMANAAMGALSSAVLVLLVGMFLSARTAIVAGLLHALSPPAVALVPQTLTEHPALLLTLLTLLCLACADRARGRRVWLLTLAGGVCFGLLLLTRPSGLFLLPALLVLLVRNVRKRAWTPKLALAFAVVSALVVAPWLYRNQRQGLGLMLSSVGGHNLYIGNSDGAVSDGSRVTQPTLAELLAMYGEAGADRWARNQALGWIAEHPGRYLQLCGVRALGLLATKPSHYTMLAFTHWKISPEAFRAYERRKAKPAAYRPYREEYADATRWAERLLRWWYAFVSPLMVLGAALAIPHWRRYALLLVPLGAYVVGLTLTFSQPRFRELSDPLFCVFVALLVSDLAFGTQRLGKRPSRRVKAILAAVAVAAWVAFEAAGLWSPLYTLDPLTP